MRAVAARHGVSLATVQRWVVRAGDQRLDRVDWSETRGGRRAVQATLPDVEELVLQLRRELRDQSDLGEFGAAAIHRTLLERQQVLGLATVPAIRTIGRILERRGVLDAGRRVRRPAPPRGWYLAEVAAGRAELDSFDIVEGLVIKGGTDVEVLNAVSLHGGLCGSWVDDSWTAKKTVAALLSHWSEHGFPDYVQFDNDTIFQGAHQWPDSFGRVTRTCLQLGMMVVFAPPRETGFQAAIEAYNGRWQEKVWSRFQHQSLADLRHRSDRFVAARQQRSASRIEAAPVRWQLPDDWEPDLSQPLSGTVVFLRRTNDRGHVHLLGRDYPVSETWRHRLVRCEVDLTSGRIRIYQLRRREPSHQPLLTTIRYEVPQQRFHG